MCMPIRDMEARCKHRTVRTAVRDRLGAHHECPCRSYEGPMNPLYDPLCKGVSYTSVKIWLGAGTEPVSKKSEI